MSRKTLLLLLICLGLVGAAIAAKRAPEKGELTGPRPRPIPMIQKGQIDELEITHQGKTTRLKRDGEHWALTEPVKAPADPQGVKSAVEKLEALEFGHVVTDQPTRLSEFDLNDDKATHVVAKGGGKSLFDIFVGKSAGSQTFVKASGKNEAWQVHGALQHMLAKDAKTWRDKTVLQFKRDDAEEITLEGPAGKVVVKREGPNGAEKKTESFALVSSPVPIEKLDDSLPNGILSALSGLRATDFADDVPAAETGLEDAAAHVARVKTKDGKVHALVVGKAKGDDYYVKVQGAPQAYLVRKFSVEKLIAPPKEFRDKTLADLKPADVTGIEIRSADSTLVFEKDAKGEFALAKPKQEIDPSKVTAMVNLFSNFKAGSFADTAEAKITGLGKPSLTAVVKAKTGGVTLAVGSASKDGSDYYVQVKGRSDVYFVKKHAIDRLKKKPDDYKKSSTPEGAMPPGGIPGLQGMMPGHP